MKKILLYGILLFSFVSVGLQAQSFKFKTTSLTVLERGGKYNEWDKWSVPLETQLYITLDLTKDKIIVYSREIQHYRILEILPKQVTKTDEVNSYLCKNQFGEACKISFMVRTNENYKTQLYIYFTDIVFCYDIEEVIE